MLSRVDNTLFKKIIVIFWAIWWLIALWTDIVGALAHLGLLHETWARDTNYPALVQSLSIYHLPAWLPPCLFVGIIFWSLLTTVLFCWASFGLNQKEQRWMQRARCAFIVSLTYWFAFFLADQLVMEFDLEQNHMVQGGFALLTFLALYLLPPSKS